SWKVNDRTTLNYGLRWEPYFPQQVTNGAIYNFSLDGFEAGQRTTQFSNAPPGFTYPGDPGFPNGFAGMNKRWNNVAPRVGVAWDPKGDGKMSLRSSYGIGYDFVNGQYHLNTAIAPPWGSDVRIQSPVGGFDNPFLGYPGGNPFPLPFDSNAGQAAPPNARFSPGANYLAIDPDIHPTTVQSFNASLQRQIGSSWVATASYIGAYTTHLWNMQALNYGLTSVTSAILNGVPVTCVPSAANFGTCMNSILQQRRVLSQIDPVNGALIANLDAHDDSGWERYNGMLLSFERRGSRLSYTANYTLSKCTGLPSQQLPNVQSGWTDPTNPSFDEGACDLDRRHVGNITASYLTPTLTSKAAVLLSDWRVSGLLRAQSGSTLNVVSGQDRALTGILGTNQRATVVVDNGYGDTSSLTNYLSPAAFAQPAFGTLGNYVRNSLYGPSRWQIDMVLARVLRMTRTQSVELRLEAFNVTNNFIRANSGAAQLAPVNNLSSATFGQILSAGDPRILQFGVKYAF
ncbi:MAG TPA: hypothetical protein VNG89_12185, partial [Vicinamibacterales bacterium]|nr:hypothetical protein [Vicinamibacterales bacterium]